MKDDALSIWSEARMSDDELFRARLAAMSADDISRLYDATVEDWQKLGITKEIFVGNMAAKAAYEAVVRPLELTLGAYIEMSDREAVRVARAQYMQGLERLSDARNPHRTVADLQAERRALERRYDAAIEAAGDERVRAAKRAYDRAVVHETERFARRVR